MVEVSLTMFAKNGTDSPDYNTAKARVCIVQEATIQPQTHNQWEPVGRVSNCHKKVAGACGQSEQLLQGSTGISSKGQERTLSMLMPTIEA